MVQTIIDALKQYLSPELVVFVISMLPIAELRGGLIAASILGIPWVNATIISVIGNILPMPIILLFVRKVLAWLKGTKTFYKLAHKYETKALIKGAEIVEKYPNRLMFALYIFVAIPLPMTGGWTGSLIAAFLNLPMRKSLPAIIGGICTAAVIMLIITYLAPSLLGIKN